LSSFSSAVILEVFDSTEYKDGVAMLKATGEVLKRERNGSKSRVSGV